MYAEKGWINIGRVDSTGRRSLWSRIRMKPGANEISPATVIAVELCAGREGRDSYLCVGPQDPLFEELLDIVCCAEYASTT